MPKWLDDNTIEGELSDEEFLKQVNEAMKARVAKEEKEGKLGNYGNDGLVTVYQEERVHNGIPYQLKVLRYFAVERLPNVTFRLRDGGMNQVGKHVVVEHDGAEPPYELKDLLGLSEFLFHDTLHSGQEDWPVRRQWDYANSLAIEDCERIEQLESEFETKVNQLREELQGFVLAVSKKAKHELSEHDDSG